MNKIPRRKLNELIKKYGYSICDDPKRCKALLLDYCGEYRREINALLLALSEGIPQNLRNISSDIPSQITLAQLRNRLETNQPISEDAAK